MIRGVRSLYHMILENVCMDVCVCVCVRIPLYLWIYAVDFKRIYIVLIFFFYSVLGMGAKRLKKKFPRNFAKTTIST